MRQTEDPKVLSIYKGSVSREVFAAYAMAVQVEKKKRKSNSFDKL